MNNLVKMNSACFTRHISLFSILRTNHLITLKNNNSTQIIEKPLDLPGIEKQCSDKLKRIVSDISKLTLLEVAELNQLLKTTLNIPDVPMNTSVPIQVAKDKENAEKEPEVVKSSYIVKMMKFDPAKKVTLIKEIKNIVEGMNLVQAKKFVESAPQVIRTEVPKDEAEKIKNQLEAAGATIMLV